ncbi:MAG: menaquinone biosynthesis protein [Trueperaceae bacterium]|nr:MAG: menaquinone biosynthesis protein [Trueperaceae bacterium]
MKSYAKSGRSDHSAAISVAGDQGSGGAGADAVQKIERLGIVSYSNVAPLHWQLEPWPEAEFVSGVPTELNAKLLDGTIDLTLISSIEFLRHRHLLKALPDFSIATLGPVYSVMLFHWRPWRELGGSQIAVTTHSATGTELLRILLETSGIEAGFVPMPPRLDDMLASCEAALLIGDTALVEAVMGREIGGRKPLVTDLGEAWFNLTKLPFTFAVWASRRDTPPSERLVAKLRSAREEGLGHLADVAHKESAKLGLSPAVLQRYLGNFRYYLEPPDRDGLTTYGRMCLPGFAPEEVGFWQM